MGNTLSSLASAEQLTAVLTHPRHQWALRTLTSFVRQLRAAHTDACLFELQRDLLKAVLETEENRAAISRVRKRLKKNPHDLPADAPELQSGLDPRLLESWRLEYVVYERVCRQLRSIGDGIAWRVFNFERSHIVALSRGEQAGPMAGKEGLQAELDFVDACWREDGNFALLHDLTTLLRVGDATVFDRDFYSLHEIKKNQHHRDRKQDRRLVTAADSIARHGPLLGGGQKLVKMNIAYRTHLDALRAALDLAHERGMQGVKAPGCRSIMAASLFTAPQRWTEDEFGKEFERRFAAYRRKTGIVSDDHKLVLSSLDQMGRNPTAPPWVIYPVSPEVAAALVTDSIFFYVAMSPDAVLNALAKYGVQAQWLQRLDGNEQPNEPMLHVALQRGRTSFQTTTLNMSEVNRLLLELVDLDVWSQHVASLLSELPAGTTPWPYFENEWKVWA